MQTVNRQYPLPNKNNVVLDDLERMRTAFTKIDEDVVETEGEIDELAGTVSGDCRWPFITRSLNGLAKSSGDLRVSSTGNRTRRQIGKRVCDLRRRRTSIDKG